MTKTAVGTDDHEKPIPEEVKRLRAATSSPVAEEIVMGLLSRLQEAKEAARDGEEAQEDNARLRRSLEALQARPSALGSFEEAIQRAHHQARHEGLWNVCPHPVCRSLEEYLHAEAKERAR